MVTTGRFEWTLAVTLLYMDDIFLLHDTGEHPECAARLESIHRRLHAGGLLSQVICQPTVSANLEDLTRWHAVEYLERLQATASVGGGRVESDTVMSGQSAIAAWKAAGSLIDAVERVVRGEQSQALCLVRPPGHHAFMDAPMGFCLLSNVAIAAKVAVERLGLSRVLIVDWDVHHGNGTQDAVYEDECITLFSAHRFPFYPGTGRKSETGRAAGLGTVFNLPLKFGISRSDFLTAFESELTKAADRCRPELVIISAGFDAHVEDPIGSLGLETQDFAELTALVQQVADIHADGRVVSSLEGGYHVERLADCVELHLETLLDSGQR
jgi:acetoin utilization deacetylase AcuC-like enzyme